MIFNGKSEYSRIFNGNTQEWIPQVPIIYNYKDSDYRPLILFEDDIDITTWEKGSITTFNLETWSEEELRFRDKDTQGVNGVVIGWDYGGTMEGDSIASYPALRSRWRTGRYRLPNLRRSAPLELRRAYPSHSRRPVPGEASDFGQFRPRYEKRKRANGRSFHRELDHRNFDNRPPRKGPLHPAQRLPHRRDE